MASIRRWFSRREVRIVFTANLATDSNMQVLIIDDHTIFRQGLTYLLSDLDASLEFTEASSGSEALAAIGRSTPGLILLDLKLLDSNGLDLLPVILDAAPTVPVAVLSGEEDPYIIRAAIDAGASGFISKTVSSDLLIAALELILDGGIYLPESVLRATRSPLSRSQDEDASELALSARQTAVLLKAIQGQANKVIAIDLGIAEGTVKAHLSAAFKVLGVRNRTEAVFAAARLGLRPAP